MLCFLLFEDIGQVLCWNEKKGYPCDYIIMLLTSIKLLPYNFIILKQKK